MTDLEHAMNRSEPWREVAIPYDAAPVNGSEYYKFRGYAGEPVLGKLGTIVMQYQRFGRDRLLTTCLRVSADGESTIWQLFEVSCY